MQACMQCISTIWAFQADRFSNQSGWNFCSLSCTQLLPKDTYFTQNEASQLQFLMQISIQNSFLIHYDPMFFFGRCHVIPQPLGIHREHPGIFFPQKGVRSSWALYRLIEKNMLGKPSDGRHFGTAWHGMAWHRQVIDIMKCGVRQGTKPAVERCPGSKLLRKGRSSSKTAGGLRGMVENIDLPGFANITG